MKKRLALAVQPEFLTRLQAAATEHGMSLSEYVVYLQEFHELKHIHLLVKQLAVHQRVGFNHVQLAQLSGLLTFLEYLRETLQFR